MRRCDVKEHEKGWRAVQVGGVVVVAAALLALFVLKVGSSSGLFAGKVRFHTRFPTTQGLNEGALVRYNGVGAGTVTAVDFDPDPASNDVIVKFSVSRSVARRMDRHVVVELRSNGPLGDKLLELRRENLPPETPLEEKSFVTGKAPVDMVGMLDTSPDLFADVQSISASLRIITERLVAGEGVVGRLLKDKEFGEQTLTDLQVTVSRLRQIVEASSEGRNLVGMLVGDQALAARTSADLERTLTSLEAVTGRIERGEGALGQLTLADSELSRAVADFGVAAKNMRAFSEGLQVSEGSLVHRLLADDAYGAKVAEDLSATARHVKSIAQKLDTGEGSAARFINEGRVHEGVDDIVRGVERSWFVSWVLKRKQKKGFQEKVDRILRESPNPDAELLELMREILEEREDGGQAARPGSPAPAAGPRAGGVVPTP